MASDRVIVVAGGADVVDPIRQALEKAGIFALACYDLDAPILNGKVADLEIVCLQEGWVGSACGARGQIKPIVKQAQVSSASTQTIHQRLLDIAQHPVPVFFVHPRPTIDLVNYLRSIGAYYVFHGKFEERTNWRGLVAYVCDTLESWARCSFCGRQPINDDEWVAANGRARLCRSCLFELASRIAQNEIEKVRYAR